MIVTTPLSGNEIYCLAQKEFSPGNLLLGNSVHPYGSRSTVTYGVTALPGSEIEQATQFIAAGRDLALQRMLQSADTQKASGVISIINQLIFSPTTTEFLCSGAAIHSKATSQVNGNNFFTAALDGQAMYACLDAYYFPLNFTFGNIVYTNGAGRTISRKFKSLKKGELHDYSDKFNQSRHLVLQRLLNDAKSKGAQAVIGIQTMITPWGDLCEMLMTGTACKTTHRFNGGKLSNFQTDIISSGLNSIEMWHMAKIGYVPKSLLIASTVYSLGYSENLQVLLKSFSKRELSDVTRLLHEARANVLSKLEHEAAVHHADKVVGIKIYYYPLGKGLFEFLAIGTAMQKTAESRTYSDQLPQAAIVADEPSVYSVDNYALNPTQTNPLLKFALSLFAILFIIFMVIGLLKTP